MATYQLEIHHVDVSGGDATIILVRKNIPDNGSETIFFLLVDVGGVGSGPGKLAKYIETYYGNQKVDFFIVSHYHFDHVQGLTYVNIEPDCLFDVGSSPQQYFPANTPICDEQKITPQYVADYLEFSDKYTNKRYVPSFLRLDSYNEQGNPKSTLIKPVYKIMDKTSKEKPVETGFAITFYAAKGVAFDGENILRKQIKSLKKKKKKIDANDLSITFTVENADKSFSYFSGGDLSGEPSLKKYYNVEGYTLGLIKKDFPAGVTIAKASHHGSDNNNHKAATQSGEDKSSNKTPGFLETLKPETLIIPCNQCKSVPGPEFIRDRLFAHLAASSSRKAYFLNDFDYNKPYPKNDDSMYNAFEKIVQNNATKASTNIIHKDDNMLLGTVTAVIITVSTAGKLNLVTPYAESNLKEVHSPPGYKIYINSKQLVPEKPKENSVARVLHAWIDVKFLGKDKKAGWFLEGFVKQAEEIISELRKGPPEKKAVILKDNFPALFKCFADENNEVNEKSITDRLKNETVIKAALYNEMLISFDACYKFENWWVKKGPLEVPREKEITLINLIIRNRFQADYQAARKDANSLSNLIFNRWGSMSVEEENIARNTLTIRVREKEQPKRKTTTGQINYSDNKRRKKQQEQW